MIRFDYKAYDESGRLVEGEIVTASRQSALETLHRRGQIPIEIDDEGSGGAIPWWQQEVFAPKAFSQTALATVIRELAILTKADMPLDEALRITAVQPMLSARMQKVMRGVLARVVEGQALSQAIATEGDMFPEYIWRLIAAGEASGKLSDVLDDLAGFLERSAEVRSDVATALVYPAVLLVAAIAAIAVILGVLLPAVVPLLKDSGAELPVIIDLLDRIREVLRNNVIELVAIATFSALVAALILQSAAVRQSLSAMALRLPMIGALITARETARFSRTLATLMTSGVAMLDALRISGSVLKNSAFKAAIDDTVEQVREGANLTTPLIACKLFPEVSTRLIAVGEQTGNLEAMLIRAAELSETLLARRLKRLTTLLTPMLTLVIGLLVGWLIISVMSALLSINDLAIN